MCHYPRHALQTPWPDRTHVHCVAAADCDRDGFAWQKWIAARRDDLDRVIGGGDFFRSDGCSDCLARCDSAFGVHFVCACTHCRVNVALEYSRKASAPHGAVMLTLLPVIVKLPACMFLVSFLFE